jgi:hypothetical protein
MSGNVTNVSGTLHVFLMALQVRLFDASDLAMRATMAAISVIGLGLIAAAVYELAGVRAASLTAWLLPKEWSHSGVRWYGDVLGLHRLR